MIYKIRKINPEYDAIKHGLFGNKGGAKAGSTWSNHLYIARQKTATGWRYFYNQAELRAAQAKQAGKNTLNTVKNNNAVKAVQRKVQTATNERSSKKAYKDSIKNYNKTANTYGQSSVQARAAADKMRKSTNDYAKSIAENNRNRYDPTKDFDKYNKANYKSAREVVRKVYGAGASAVISVKVSEKMHRKIKDSKSSIDRGRSFLENAINSRRRKRK